MRAVLRTLGRDLQPAPRVRNALLNLARPGPEGRRLRFETLMQYFLDYYDEDLEVLRPFDERPDTPHMNHMILAELARRGHWVCTTNFDSLIEGAFLAEPQNRSSFKQIHTDAGFAEWCRTLAVHPIPIFKLHGTLSRYSRGRWYEARRSIQATLNQVGKQGTDLSRAKGKRAFLTLALQSRDLIVLGYSGSDDFDITGELIRVSSPRRVIWIDHQRGDLPPRAWPVFHPGRPGGTSATCEPLLSSLVANSRSRTSVSLFRMDTELAMKEIARALTPTVLASSATGFRPVRKTPLGPWSRRRLMPEWRRYHLAAELFGRFGRATLLKICAEAALFAAREHKDRVGELLSAYVRSWSDMWHEEYGSGARVCSKVRARHASMRASWRSPLLRKAFARVASSEVENLYLGGNFAAATRLGTAAQRRMQRWAENRSRPGEREFLLAAAADLGCVLGNLHLTVGRIQHGLGDYRRALSTYRRVGQLDDEAYALSGCADGLRLSGCYSDAVSYYTEAMERSQKLGDEWQSSLISIGLADAKTRAAQYGDESCNEATELLHSAMTVFRRTGDRLELALTARLFGDILRAKPQPEIPQALRLYRRARRSLTGIGYSPGILAVELVLADCDRTTGRYERAVGIANYVAERARRRGLHLLRAHALIEAAAAGGRRAALTQAAALYASLGCAWGVEAARDLQAGQGQRAPLTPLTFVQFD